MLRYERFYLTLFDVCIKFDIGFCTVHALYAAIDKGNFG